MSEKIPTWKALGAGAVIALIAYAIHQGRCPEVEGMGVRLNFGCSPAEVSPTKVTTIATEGEDTTTSEVPKQEIMSELTDSENAPNSIAISEIGFKAFSFSYQPGENACPGTRTWVFENERWLEKYPEHCNIAAINFEEDYIENKSDECRWMIVRGSDTESDGAIADNTKQLAIPSAKCVDKTLKEKQDNGTWVPVTPEIAIQSNG